MPIDTVQAVRQVIFARLTNPAITYSINGGAPITLGVANVAGRPQHFQAVGTGNEPPSPFIAFTVGTRGNVARTGERILVMKLWVSSSAPDYGDDEVTELYERGVRARIHTGDAEGMNGWPPIAADLSRIDGGGASLGVAVRECIEQRMLAADFEEKTARWYVTADYTIVAN